MYNTEDIQSNFVRSAQINARNVYEKYTFTF